MLLYIVRHGDPIYVTDTLTDRGRAQAEAVGQRMADVGINRIFTSPMGRARETAAPACRLLGLEAEVEEWAHEVEEERLTPYPDGKLKSVTALPSYLLRENGNINIPYERGTECAGFRESRMAEVMPVIAERGRDFLERLGYREENGVYRILTPNEDRVAIFCHSVLARAWISTMLHIPVHLMWADFAYTHTGVTVLEFPNHESGFTAPRCLCYSDISHLYKAGLDTVYDNRVKI
jgi:probable phosphoglycerate mutase